MTHAWLSMSPLSDSNKEDARSLLSNLRGGLLSRQTRFLQAIMDWSIYLKGISCCGSSPTLFLASSVSATWEWLL